MLFDERGSEEKSTTTRRRIRNDKRRGRGVEKKRKRGKGAKNPIFLRQNRRGEKIKGHRDLAGKEDWAERTENGLKGKAKERP